MKKIILFIHQLPQNLIGLIVLLWNKIFCKKDSKPLKKELDGIVYYKVKHVGDCGVSLGNFIFLDSDVNHNENDIRHEHGHQLQSKKLGWFYVFIIGFPSLIGNLIDRFAHDKYHKNDRCWYYKQPWEAWADKLGGVKR